MLRSSRLRRGRSAPSVWTMIALVAVLLVAGAASGQLGGPWLGDSAPGSPEPGNSAPAPSAPTAGALPDSALAALAELPVKGRAPKTGYDRDAMFGDGWLDTDRNGCDARNDVLARDLAEVTREGACRVMSGVLTSPYTGEVVTFERGPDTSSMVQIDHVVALSDAWQKGAQQLTQEQRVDFANDPVNLLAVDGFSNSQKGAGDAATWLPSEKSFRCEYVARQVSVKVTHGLWVTQAEHDAIASVLSGCPGQGTAGGDTGSGTNPAEGTP